MSFPRRTSRSKTGTVPGSSTNADKVELACRAAPGTGAALAAHAVRAGQILGSIAVVAGGENRCRRDRRAADHELPALAHVARLAPRTGLRRPDRRQLRREPGRAGQCLRLE